MLGVFECWTKLLPYWEATLYPDQCRVEASRQYRLVAILQQMLYTYVIWSELRHAPAKSWVAE